MDLWMVWDKDKGLICICEFEEALKEYEKELKVNEEFYSGECMNEDELGYYLILAKVHKSSLTKWTEPEIDDFDNEVYWEWVHVDNVKEEI